MVDSTNNNNDSRKNMRYLSRSHSFILKSLMPTIKEIVLILNSIKSNNKLTVKNNTVTKGKTLYTFSIFDTVLFLTFHNHCFRR